MCGLQDSRGEVQRLIDTFEIAAEEATRMYGAGLFTCIEHPSQKMPLKLQAIHSL